MANTASAKKAVRQMGRKTIVNRNRRSRVRTYVRKVEEVIEKGDQTAAVQALKSAQPQIMRAVTKGVYHRNTAARKISRLSKRINNMAT